MVAGQKAHVVPAEARGQRLDQHLARAFPELSRARIQALIEEGHVQVDGRPMKPSARLKGQERIALRVPPPTPARAEPEDLPLSVLYEDPHLAILDKAPGMVVHPGAGHARGTLVNALLHRMKGIAGPGEALRAGIVHRLDKDTSGCLLVAKSERAFTALQAAFKSRQVRKRYLAIVRGAPKPSTARIETLYARHPVHRQRFTGRVKTGKRAATVYAVRERFEGAALLEVELETGRTHQIRVHLSEAGHPLLGDGVYGGRSRRSPEHVAQAERAVGRQALHAWELSFAHPVTGHPLTVQAPLPDDFQKALEILRRHPC